MNAYNPELKRAFEKIKLHLLAQRCRSEKFYEDRHAFSSHGFLSKKISAYRGHNGTRSAIGCLILDEYYIPELENHHVYDEYVQAALSMSGVVLTRDMLKLLSYLQKVHDEVDPYFWQVALSDFDNVRDNALIE